MSPLKLAYRTFDPFTDAFEQQSRAFHDQRPYVDVEAAAWDPQQMYEQLVALRGLLPERSTSCSS